MAKSFRLAASGKRTRRWLAGGTAAAIVMLGVPVVGLPTANAGPIDGFQVDGNTTAPAEDWNTIYSGSTPPVKLGLPETADKANRVLSTTVDNVPGTGQDTTTFGSNNKENDGNANASWPKWDYTNTGQATGKSDFGFVATYSWRKKSNNDLYLAFAFDRGFGTGTAQYWFELNQVNNPKNSSGNPAADAPNPTRTAGDLRINIYDQGSGVFDPPKFQKWTGSAWGAEFTPPVGAYDITSNTTPTTGIPVADLPSYWKTNNIDKGVIQKDAFVEGVLNLSSFEGGVLGCPSTGFAAFNARSITGASEKNLVDYIGSQAINIPSACAQLTVTKSSPTGTALPGTKIAISPNPLPLPNDGTDPYIVTTGADGTYTIPEVVPGTYTVSEFQAPLRYIKIADPQKITLGEFGSATVNFVDPLGDVAWTKSYAGYTDTFPSGFTGATFTVTRADNASPKRDISNAQFAGISGITATGCPTACTFDVTDNGPLDAENTTWGKIRVNNLPIGVYTITEKSAPVGFKADTGSATAEVPVELPNADVVNGKVINHLVTATRVGASSGSATFNNPRNTGKIAVAKTSLATGAEVKAGVGGVTTGAKFQLYRVVGAFDKTSNETNDAPLPSLGVYVEAPATVSGLAWGESYYFVEVSAPAPYNVPDKNWTDPYPLTAADADAGTVAKTLSIADPETTITTVATPNETGPQTAPLPNAKISDSATVSGLNSKANGTVSFKLYYSTVRSLANGTTPSSICTAGTLVSGYTSSAKIGAGTAYPVANGSVTVPSAQYTATKAGFYYWVASYTGDGFNSDAAGICGDPLEVSEVVPAVSGIVTTAGGDATLAAGNGGAALYDTAKLTGLSGLDATGTITFKVYKGITCSAAPIDTIAVDIAGKVLSDGKGGFYTEVTSSSVRNVIVYEAGTYTWTAAYAPGDANNTASAEECGVNKAEQWTVGKASPALVTDTRIDKAQDLKLPSTSVTDTATVTKLTTNATGNVVFQLYAATDTTCAAAPIFTSNVSVTGKVDATGKVTVTSAPFIGIVTAGTYKWVAVYEGDANNSATPRPACGLVDGNNYEISVIEKAQPNIVTTATDTVKLGVGTAGAVISDTATLGNLTPNAMGTVTFSVYGPFAQGETITCSAAKLVGDPIDVSFPKPTPLNGSLAVNALVTVNEVGTYAWYASYGGDDNNLPIDHKCGDIAPPNKERSVVTPATPAISTQATSTATLGIQEGASVNISDTAFLTGLTANATGTVTFALYGPDDATCSTEALATVDAGSIAGLVKADGTAEISSGDVPVNAAGTYRWIATYSGDKNNVTIAGLCNDKGETTVVTQGKPELSKVATMGGEVISGTVDGEEIIGKVEVGQVITYVVTVANTGTSDVTGPVTDTLPAGLDKPTNITPDSNDVVPVPVLVGDHWTITWNDITVSPGEPIELKYDAKVLPSAAAVGKDTLINRAAWVGLEDTTTTLVKWITVDATAFCEVTTPRVTYAVVTHNLDETSADLVWLDENKKPITDAQAAVLDGQAQTATWLQDRPLTGTLLYPGTVSTGGFTTDWPGWKLVDGKWVVDPDGLKPLVYLQATVNPTAISTAALYPPAASGCNPPAVPGLDKSSPTEKGSVGNPSGNVLPGATVDYSVKITNDGGSSITSNLVDTLPAGVTPVAGSYNVAPSSVVGQTITWAEVTLGAGETKTFTFKVTVNADVAAGELINTATWAGLSDATVHVVTPGVPGLVKSSPTEVGSTLNPSGNVATGSTIHYVITLTNTGGATVTSDLVDTLPAGVVPVAGTYTPGAPDSVVGSTLTWKNVAVAGGKTVTYEFDATVSAAAGPGEIVDLVNNATWANLTDSAAHVVLGAGVVLKPTLDKSSDPAAGSTVKVGDVITYTVKVGNDGNVPLSGDLVDTLPNGVKVVGDYTRSDDGNATPDTVTSTTLTWKAVTVQPGDVITFTYKVEVLDGAKDLDTLLNTATWLGLKDSTEHTVTVPQPPLAETGVGMNPLTSLLWALVLGGLGVVLLLVARRREEQED